jgi:hypothetical protein
MVETVELMQIFAEARAFRDEAARARKLAGTTSGRLQGELHQIAALYDRLADGKDPESPSRHIALPLTADRLTQLARFETTAWPD